MKRKRSWSLGKRRKRPWPRQRMYRHDLERFLINKFNAVTPGTKLDGLRSNLQLKLKTEIEAITPAARVVPYGSTSAGVSVKSSDVDITVIVESDELDSIVGEVKKVLRKAGITQLKEWCDGNRCGFTGHDEHSGTHIDLSFNCESAHKDSDFIYSVVNGNWTVRIFLTLIKQYSKCHGINNPTEGTLKSIGYIYMGMFHLQQEGFISKFVGKEDLSDIIAEAQSFEVEVQNTSQASSSSSSGIGELLCSFFRFYSEDYDFGRDAISVIGGSVVKKRSLGWVDDEIYTLCIVDPFGDQNIGRTVTEDGLDDITRSFREAYRILANEEMPCKLFKLYEFESDEN